MLELLLPLLLLLLLLPLQLELLEFRLLIKMSVVAYGSGDAPLTTLLNVGMNVDIDMKLSRLTS